MAWRGAGSLSRSTIRAPSIRLCLAPTSSAPRLQSSRLSFAPSGRKRNNYGCSSCKENEQSPKNNKIMKKTKNFAISIATNSLARELKSIKNDLCFMQEQCCLLEEENRRLRDGFTKRIRPEENDLVRLQLEALLAKKSRLTNENANLVREKIFDFLHHLIVSKPL